MSDVQFLDVSYDFIDNGTGEVMLVMDAPEGEADDDNARLVYDGKSQAVLIRNSHQIVRLPLLAADAIEMLNSGISNILVTEMNGEDINDVYEAAIQITGSPLPGLS